MIDRDYPHGLTIDGGRYRLESLLRGLPQEGLWQATRSGQRAVVVTFRRLPYTTELDALLSYSGPGIAAPLFIGPPDLFDDDGEEIRRQHTAVVDEQPPGIDLTAAGRLSADETAALGIALCDALEGWAATHHGTVTRGLRPETIFVSNDGPSRRFAGATPRTFFLLGNEGSTPAYPRLTFDPPAASTFEFPTLDGLFTVATILWFAFTGDHPYAIPGTSMDTNIWEDRRVVFVGPEPLGRVLAAALVADPDARIAIDMFREQLRGLIG